jgi:hypothetical protein
MPQYRLGHFAGRALAACVAKGLLPPEVGVLTWRRLGPR